MSSNTTNMKFKKKKQVVKDSHGRIVFLLVAVVIFIIVLISTVFSDWLQIIENKEQTTKLSNKYVLLKEEAASLNSEVIKLQDPEYIARYAREKYLYTKDGEKILKIIDGKIVEEEVKDE